MCEILQALHRSDSPDEIIELAQQRLIRPLSAEEAKRLAHLFHTAMVAMFGIQTADLMVGTA